MVDIVIILILVCILGGAAYYIYRAKKRGESCIGCPYARQCSAKQCGGKCNGGCGNAKKNK